MDDFKIKTLEETPVATCCYNNWNRPTDPRPRLAKVVVKGKSTHLIPSAPPSAQSVTHCLQV
ncbi:hypothetical protein J6590_073424 [Homalodisca vitripennis]|nr:hypothetical protein J6590_073424 [Homalodisca vitripennis]